MYEKQICDILDDRGTEWDNITTLQPHGRVYIETSWNGSFHDAYDNTYVRDTPELGVDVIVDYTSYEDLYNQLKAINDGNLVEACARFDLSRKAE